MSCSKCKKALRKVANIASGFKETITKNNPSIEAASADRLAICTNCEYATSAVKVKHKGVTTVYLRCTICKCYLEAKTRVLNEKCPKGYWSAIT